METVNKLQRNIMHRVYYIYGLRLVTHPVSMYGLVLVALLLWLKELVFFARIWQSFVNTPVGDIGTFTFELFSNADSLTLLVTFALAFIGFMWLRKVLASFRFPTFAV